MKTNGRVKGMPRTSLIGAVLAGALILAGCGGGGEDEAQGSLRKIGLRLDFVPTGKDVMWTYGIEKGYFRDAGIELDIRPGKGSSTTMQTVANGTDDFGISEGGAYLTLASKGLEAKAVMSVYAQSMLAILSPADEPITNPGQLAGKSVAVTAGDGPSTLLPALLDLNKVPSSKINEVNMQPAAKLTALLTDRVDTVSTLNIVSASLAARGKKTHVLPYAKFGVQVPGYYLVASNSMLTGEPGLVKKFVAAASKSMEAAIANPEKAVDSFVEQYPRQRKEKALDEFKIALPYIKSPDGKNRPAGWMSMKDVQRGVELMSKYGGVTTPRKPEDYVSRQLAS